MLKVEQNIKLAHVAKLISHHRIVLFFNGRSEAGCRALGNRSIVSNPTTPNGKQIVNQEKGREWFRPLAASILEEELTNWFITNRSKTLPYMTHTLYARPEHQNKIPNALHVDNSCRIQTVNKNQNLNYYNLILDFYKLTNIPLLINTSFNLAGEPIVETPKDAIASFMKSAFHYLYFADHGLLLTK
jgi:carbamoyltransferase